MTITIAQVIRNWHMSSRRSRIKIISQREHFKTIHQCATEFHVTTGDTESRLEVIVQGATLQ